MKFWTWYTQEVADMIEWMKEYNENVADENKIRFYGFDIQSVDNDINQILKYLEKVDSDNIEEYKLKLSKVGNILNPNKRKKVEDLITNFTDNKDKYINRSSQEEYELMIRHIKIIDQWVDFYKKRPRSINEGFNTRDKYMAENVKWIIDHETKYHGNDRIMLWAHNGHVSKDYLGLSIMGNNLKNIYGDEYYSLGFDFYQGSFRSIPMDVFNKVVKGGPQKFYIESSPHNSYRYEMEKTGVPISFLDFKNASRDEEILKFLSYETKMNNIGAAYMGNWFASRYLLKLIPNKSNDGVIFIKTTNASQWPSYDDYPMKDGNKLLKEHYLVSVLIAIFLLIMSYRKSKSRDVPYSIEEFHILGKNMNDNKNIKGVNRWVLKLHEYVSEMSTIKYIVLATIILFTINLTLRINDLTPFADNIKNLRELNITAIIILMLNIIIENFKFYFLPLTILAFFSQDKSIKSYHIIVSSLILVLFRFRFGDPFSIIIYFLNGIILNYSYTLYYYKNKKPFTVINTIKIGESILKLFI